MGYLRLVPARPSAPHPAASCIEAFDRELSYLFQTLRRMGAGPREIEDLVQEVFLVLHRNWATLDTERPLRPYLCAVAFRVVSGNRRRHAAETPYAGLDVEDEAVGPEASLQAEESRRLLLSALDRLPLSRRVVLVMHDLDDVPIVEIARRLSLTRFGAYARLRKARKELASALRRQSKGDPVLCEQTPLAEAVTRRASFQR